MTKLSNLTEETIRARTKTGDTPLHLAAKTGRICEIPSHLLQTELFLARNHDRQNKPHRTPLHIAAMYGYLDQVPQKPVSKKLHLDRYNFEPRWFKLGDVGKNGDYCALQEWIDPKAEDPKKRQRSIVVFDSRTGKEVTKKLTKPLKQCSELEQLNPVLKE